VKVKIIKRISVVFFIFLTIPFPLFGQVGEVTLNLSPQIEMSQVIYVSDFDFIQKGNVEYLFDVDLAINQSGNYKIAFELERNAELIGEAITNAFTPAAGNYHFDNIQLNTGIPISGELVKFDRQSFYKPSDTFQKEILRGGKLPRAVYIFRVCLLNASNIKLACDWKKIVISNPSYIKPISPGNEVGVEEPEEIYSEFPVFQFDADLLEPQYTSFHIQIFKKLDYHASIDEVLTTTPHLDQIIDRMVFSYEEFPNAQPLEAGTYLWRVEMIVQTSGGPEIIPSPAYAFIVKDVTGDDQNKIEIELVVDIGNLLRSLIGDRAESIIEKLNNFRLKEIRLNGDAISVSELYEIIDNYQGHTVEIKDLELLSSQE
jgi:hypothetical protein